MKQIRIKCWNRLHGTTSWVEYKVLERSLFEDDDVDQVVECGLVQINTRNVAAPNRWNAAATRISHAVEFFNPDRHFLKLKLKPLGWTPDDDC